MTANRKTAGTSSRWVLPVLLLLGSWLTFCAAAIRYQSMGNEGGETLFAGLGLISVALPVLLWLQRKRGRAVLLKSLDECTRFVERLPENRLGLWTALAAGIGLYLELVVIRFHSSCFEFFAFFKNVSLLSCFLGLGLGYVLGKQGRLWLLLAIPLFAGQLILLHLLRFTNVGQWLQNPIAEQIPMGWAYMGRGTNAILEYAFLVAVFGYNALCFVPLGQLPSRLMGRLPKLTAYSWNLLGSLAGILLFYALSFLWTPPAVWFAVGFVALTPFLRGDWVASIVTGLAAVGVLAMNPDPSCYDVYSPYQILTVHPIDHDQAGAVVEVNHQYFQRIIDLGPHASSVPLVALARAHYDLPYVLKPAPTNVLVVGSGTGNDVASALLHGAAHVDAVEIDPAILRLGELLHPDKPYASSRVTKHVQDARAFIRYSHEKYDLIVYGLLDSHTAMSGLSGVRLDSYVYTVEAFRETRARLKEDGVMSLCFATMTPGIRHKFNLMLTEAFDGQPPIIYQSTYDTGYFFIEGKNIYDHPLQIPFGITLAHDPGEAGGVYADPSTDDWPFLYMAVRKYPLSYLVMIGLILASAVVYVTPVLKMSGGFSGSCFLLGAGFMLLETKAITELALYYGSTWVVVGVVIIAILVMAFLGNLVVMRFPRLPLSLAYGLLLASLGLTLGAPSLDLSSQSVWGGRILATGIVTLPLFFSGIVFSSEMNRTRSIAAAMGSNLLGAMAGGCLEYNSMYFGFHFLYVLAMAIYALAAITTWRARKITPSPVDLSAVSTV
jgi:spermine/spermidine synthase